MKISLLKHVILPLLLTGAVVCCIAAPSRRDARAARQKAKYYYTEGARFQAEGKADAAYENYRKAYETDPTFAEASSAYGRLRLGVANDTLNTVAEMLRSLDLMKDYVDKYPDDTYESLYYGYVAGQLDTIPEAVRVFERTATRHPENTNTLLHLSDAYANGGQFTEAARTLDRFQHIEGLNPQVSLRKISYYLADKDTVSARAEAEELLASNPHDASYAMTMGNFYDIIAMPDSAMAYYLRAEELDPEIPGPKLALANHYRENGDSVAYDKKIYEVLLCEDFGVQQKAEMLAQYLQSLFTDKHDTQRGDYLFNVLREQYPHEPTIRDLAARYDAAKGNFKLAEEEISYALDMDPDNLVYWGQLMTYQSADKRFEDALASYQKATARLKPDESLQMLHAGIAAAAKNYPLAIASYEKMIADIDSTLPLRQPVELKMVRPTITLAELDKLSSLMTAIGDTYHMAEKNDSSYLAFDNALVFNGDNPLALNNYAYFLSEDGGDLDKAAEMSSRVMRGQEADNPTYIDTYAWILFLKGDLDKALEKQAEAIRLTEENDLGSSELYDHYSRMLAKAGRYEEAAKALDKALELAMPEEDVGAEPDAKEMARIEAMKQRKKELDKELEKIPEKKEEKESATEPEKE